MTEIRTVVLNIILCSILVYGQSTEKDGRIVLDYSNRSLKEVIKEIRAKTGNSFIYDEYLVRNTNVSAHIKETNVNDALKKILSGSGLSFKLFDNNTYVIFKKKKPVDKPVAALVIDKTEIQEDTVVTVFKQAEMITKATLDYPAAALKNREQGNVEVKVIINKLGNVCRATVEQTSGYPILDSAAVDYARDIKFLPATANGKPKSSFISMIFKYSLTEYPNLK